MQVACLKTIEENEPMGIMGLQDNKRLIELTQSRGEEIKTKGSKPRFSSLTCFTIHNKQTV